MLTRLLLLTLILLFTGNVYSLGKHSIPVFQDSWLPNATTSIATFEGESITEEDLYLWLFLTNQDPFIARDWRQAAENSSLRARLEAAIEGFVEAKLLYPNASANQPQTPLSLNQASHLLASWPAVISYAEQQVRGNVVISENDLLYAYKLNSDRFETPPTVSYNRIDVAIAGGISIQTANERATQVRNAVQTGQTPEQILQAYGDWITPDSKLQLTFQEIPTTTLDDATFAVLEKLFPGQVSPPTQRQRSFRLLQLISKTPAKQIPFEQVREQLQREIFPTLYRQQFGLFAVQNVRSRFPLNRVGYLKFMESEMAILRMNDFELSTEEFLAYVNEFPNPAAPNDREKKLAYSAEEILQGEGIIQELQSTGLLDSTYYPQAFTYAQWLVARNRFLNAPTDEITTDQLNEYVAANQEALAPAFDYTIWAFSASIPETFVGNATTRADLQRRVNQEQADLILRSRQLLEERASIGSEAAYAVPETVMNRLLRTASNAQYFSFKNLGGFTPSEAASDLGLSQNQLVIGQFSGPRQFGNELISYYIAETRPRQIPPMEKLRELAKKKITEEKRLGEVHNRIATAKRQGTLQLNFP
ncbi:MAG: peptidylprolyl isomerase [Sumerlaeia bacterium]